MDRTTEERAPESDERGASLVEYALLVALIAVAALVALTFFGDSLGGSYSSIGSAVRAP